MVNYNLYRVFSQLTSTVLDLLPTRNTRGDNLPFIRLRLDGPKQFTPANRHGDLVVLFLKAKGAGHATTPGIYDLYPGIGNQFQHVRGG